MKTTFYTYRNREKIFVEQNRFYLIKSKRDFDKLVNHLLQYDAVSTPFAPEDKVKYPFLLELQSGFAPVLTEVTFDYAKRELNKYMKYDLDLISAINKELEK